VHQNHDLIPNLRVVQNVVAGKLGQRGFLESVRSMIRPGREDQRRVHELLERVGIPEKLFERTDTLSGGQAQRVALARALFQEPRALLADEPVASVDPARARDLIRLMRDLAREDGLTLVACLHDLMLAREFFPRAVGLRAGRVAFDSPTEEVPAASFEELYRLETTASAP
jgi:phosphonate transport system ATP-binding protein